MSDRPPQLTDSAIREYDRLREGSILIELPQYALVELTGEDRKGWLQGQVTNDLRHLTPGASRAFCVCEATGHLLAAVESWALDDRIVMTVAQEQLQPLLDRVERMTILEDVVARSVSEEYLLLSLQGPSATRDLSAVLELPALDAGKSSIEDVEVWLGRSNRTGMGGWDVWIPVTAQAVIESLRAKFGVADSSAVETARIEAGVPQWGKDMGPKTLPPELGSAFESRNVSYSKGCYMGQEVLMRIHSRGHTNKTWMGLISESPIVIGTALIRRGKEVGVVTSATHSPDYGYIAAAMVRNEAAQNGEKVLIGDQEAEVREMPILRFD